ncbi:MAG: TonB C-terminal domain-containing protein [Myxococcota bacterium]|nr:TonB C-terminal domain-containing protein [Myxococcota bacterium]
MRSSQKRRFKVTIVFSFVLRSVVIVAFSPAILTYHAIKVLFAKENDTLRVALLLSVLLHLAVLLPLVYFILTLEPDEDDSTALQVDLWGAEDDVLEEVKTPEEQLEEYSPEEEIPEGQVVQAPPSKDTRRPDKTRFLAEQDARVEKETKARIRLPGDSQVSEPQIEHPQKGRDTQTVTGGMQPEQHTVAPLPDKAVPDKDGHRPQQKKAPPALEDFNLRPSMEAMASAIRGSGLDHLENVLPGDMTVLNTRGWEYASFFNRVKRKVERYWRPDLEYRKNDPYGNIYGFKDRTTVLLVVLRGDGSLKKAYIMGSSGVGFLDQEAREALELAAPFPNVPTGLKDKNDGLVKFTFHFIVEVGGQPIFRMRRYQ